MFSSPSSSPAQPKPPLVTRTNIPLKTLSRQSSLKSFLQTTPDEKKPKRQSLLTGDGPNKRIKLSFSQEDVESDTSCTDSEWEDSEDETAMTVDSTPRRPHPFQQMNRLSMRPGGPSNLASARPASEPTLRSFVSSNKADVFQCKSQLPDRYLTPPYACSYSNASKEGRDSRLAVADEEGTINIFNTARRQDWDGAPQYQTLTSHQNGVFQVKWNHDDSSIASCSGDQSIRITNLETSAITHVFQGHSSTIKCLSWDPNHRELLASGSRDGTICIWDLRMSERQDEEDLEVVRPCQIIAGAHDTQKPKRGRRPKSQSGPPGITSLLHPDTQPHGLVSAAAHDGILRYWDLRALSTPSKRTPKAKSKQARVLYSSPLDPTALHGSRRPRGILSLSAGRGPTAGLIFALAADSSIHTYSLPSLQPYVNSSHSLSNPARSFYVTLSVSACGRWLATGGAGGTASLFDVANSSVRGPTSAIQLKGQGGEVGAVDWAQDSLATCADDGTVRVWRPDIDVYRQCQDDPDEQKWNWTWSL